MKPNLSNVSDAVRRLNPHLFNLGQAQGGVAQSKRGEALVAPAPAKKTRRRRVAGSGKRPASPVLRITIVRFGAKPLDGDNLQSACKGIRDAIAKWFGFDDADRFIQWQYGQVESKGDEGLAVKAELLPEILHG